MRGTVSLDRAGRIVVPKSVRDRLRLSPGDTFDLVVQGDELTLRPRRSATPLQKERGVWVFRTGQPLTAAETDETLQMIRTQRNRHNAGGLVKAFLDTSVLVATFYADHEHHQPSIDLFLRFGTHDACCGAHSLAEVYATLTGMPAPRRVSGDQALLFLGNIRDQMTLVALVEHEYVQVTEAAAAAGLAGGAIYDAILGQCALKANAEVIYTWNTHDFLRLPQPISSRVSTPDRL